MCSKRRLCWGSSEGTGACVPHGTDATRTKQGKAWEASRNSSLGKGRTGNKKNKRKELGREFEDMLWQPHPLRGAG